MGTLTSKPIPRKIEIGRCNITAQGIYNMYGLEDKIYQRQSTQRSTSDRTLLEINLDKINKEFSKKLKNSNDDYVPLSVEIINMQNDPLKLAVNLVVNGIKNYPIYYDSNISGNQLILCKENIFELTDNISELTELILFQTCCNYITKIPSSIIMLQKLRSLNLSRNQLRNIPPELCTLKSLNHLDLSHNFLKDLPENFSSFQNLHALHLDNNSFTEIPIFISKIKSLKTLIISDNFLENIPLQIIRMPFLMEFDAMCSTFIYKNIFQKQGDIDLLEKCSRHLIIKTLSVYKNIDRSLLKHLLNVEECGFCGGPLFNAYYLVIDSYIINSNLYPVKYKLCKKHFKHQKYIVGALFGRSHHSMPYDMLLKKNLCISELFDPYKVVKKRYCCLNLLSNKISLQSLTYYNNPNRRKTLFRNVDQYNNN